MSNSYLPDNINREISNQISNIVSCITSKINFILSKINQLNKRIDTQNTIIKGSFVSFVVDDGKLRSPINGATQYINPNTQGLPKGLILKNGLPLTSNIQILSTGGFEFTTSGESFVSGDSFIWLLLTDLS